jgi:hypothetical protein
MIARPFQQVVVWPGTIVGEANVADFEKFVADEFNGTRAKYIREVYTNPDQNALGEDVPDTGGRCDLLFSVHFDDIGKFAVARLAYGMRWLDDIYGNGGGHLYPADVRELLCWRAEDNEYREDGSETGSVGE